MTQHTWRLTRRAGTLKKVFSDQALETVWSKYVKKGLRKQIIDDLHDYNDINNLRRVEFALLQADIVNGRYTPSQGYIYTQEKSNGVCRHVLIPSVRDAVFLQAIVEFMAPDLLARQPSTNSFFSRSHSAPKTDFALAREDPIYPWFIAWKRFSKKRELVVSSHDYIAITDITNYFDSIRLDQLRNIVSSVYRNKRSQVSEVVLDLVIEAFNALTWVPDYLPRRHIGLTQVNFDAPRLFAHVYLYEIDAFLQSANKGLFLRWVDDISFPGSNKEQMKHILGQLDDLLYARGCRLNLSKTKILSAKEAHRYFQYSANAQLERLEGSRRLSPSQTIAVKKLIDRMEKERRGHWDKVCARAIRLLTNRNVHLGDGRSAKLLRENSYLRPAIFQNMVQMGYAPSQLKIIFDFLHSPAQRCDASIFLAWSVISDWTNVGLRRVSTFRHAVQRLCTPSAILRSPAYFIGSLRYTILYEDSHMLHRSCVSGLKHFGHIDFVVRQVAGALAALPPSALERQDLDQLLRKKYSNASSSILQNLALIDSEALGNNHIKGYVVPTSLRSGYGIERFLIALACARSPNCSSAQREKIGRTIKAHTAHERILHIWDREFGIAPLTPSIPIIIAAPARTSASSTAAPTPSSAAPGP
ncbi:RNA-directed DNA polymerase [Falsiroseomonas sp.]|uniref:RNA-directed DNA polymerase n=1 Tax=Falsiroseomonas sp. TaxID=2870721 RepID=UPI003564828A